MTHYTEQDLLDMFDECLDDCHEMVKLCGMEYDPSTALKRLDAIAYGCAFNGWLAAAVTDEVIFEHENGEYYDTAEQETDMDDLPF